MIKPSDPFCIADTRVHSWQNFADDVATLRGAIASHGQICNLFQSRYAFIVGLAAAVLNGQRTVLPPSRAAQALAHAIGDRGTLVLGGEDLLLPSKVPHLDSLPARTENGDLKQTLDALAVSSTPIDVFTSGSTGEPQVQSKTWERLTNGAALTDALIATSGVKPPHALICTTPHQHMYGLEAAVFACVAHQHCLVDMPAFYPADLETAIQAAHEAGRNEIVLASSPVHLRFLADAIVEQPAVRCIISATAPLPTALAEKIESRSGIAVFEIYGSTETGSIAWRRTTSGDIWSKRYDVSFDTTDIPVIADAPHFGGVKALGDMVELTGPNRFRLLGRVGDMISIAGKRHALGALNAIFPDAPALSDGVILRLPSDDPDDLLGAVAVRNETLTGSVEECRRHIRRYMVDHVDPIFIPRKILFVDQIRRNETGKVTAETIDALTRLFDT